MAEWEQKAEASSLKACKTTSASPPFSLAPANSLYPTLSSCPTAPACFSLLVVAPPPSYSLLFPSLLSFMAHPQFIDELASQLAQTLAVQSEEGLKAKRELQTKKRSGPAVVTIAKRLGHWKSECRTHLKVLKNQKCQKCQGSPQWPWKCSKQEFLDLISVYPSLSLS